jgi:hypothetical protein
MTLAEDGGDGDGIDGRIAVLYCFAETGGSTDGFLMLKSQTFLYARGVAVEPLI